MCECTELSVENVHTGQKNRLAVVCQQCGAAVRYVDD